MLGQRARVAVLGLLGLSSLLARASARTILPINDTVSGRLGLEEPLADCLSVVGNRDDGNSVWETRGLPAGAVSVTSGDVLLSDLTLSSALLTPGRFLVPSVLQLAPGVPLSLLRVRLSLASCHELLGQQQRACDMLPWAAVRVNSGSLAVDGWSGDGVTLRNVTVSCSPTASDPSPPPPCVALTASTAAELASALYALAGNGIGSGSGAEPPPTYVTLRANISLAPGGGWPLPFTGSPTPIPITRNLTLAGAPLLPSVTRVPAYAAYAGAANGTGGTNLSGAEAAALAVPGDPGIAAAMPPVAAGWVWPPLVALNLAARWDVVSVEGPAGALTLTGLVLEDMAIGVPRKEFPLSLVAGQTWAVRVSRPRSLWVVDTIQVNTAEEFSYWQYWLTLALTPAEQVKAQVAWISAMFPDTMPSNVDADQIFFPRANSTRVQFRRALSTGHNLVFPAVVTRHAIASVLPDRKVPLSEMAGAGTCAELAAALGAEGDAYKPVVVLTSDISLRDRLRPGAPAATPSAAGSNHSSGAATPLPYVVNPKYLAASVCPAGSWPEEGVRMHRSMALVGDVGWRLTVLDWGDRAGAVVSPTESETVLTIKGMAMKGNALYPRGGPTPSLAPLAHQTIAINPVTPKVNLVLINVSIVVPAEEVQLVAALAAQQPVPPNTLPPQALAELKAVLQTSRIAGGNTSARRLPGGGYDVLLSTMYSTGMTGTTVRLTSDLEASLGPGLARRGPDPFGFGPPVVDYLGGPGATPDGLNAYADRGSGKGSAFPTWAVALATVGGGALFVALPATILWLCSSRRSQRPGSTRKRAQSPGANVGGSAGDARRASTQALLPAGPEGAGLGTPSRLSSAGAAVAGSVGAGVDDGRPAAETLAAAPAALPMAVLSSEGGASAVSHDSFDQPPSDLAELADAGLAELPAEAELASMVAEFKEALSGGEELRIAEVLGAGAHGVVYRATWKGLSVAVKTLRFSDRMYGDEALRRAALREAAICCTLHHPNVVTTYTYELKPVRTVALAAPGAGLRAGRSAEAAAGRRGSDGPPGAPSGPGTGALRIVEPDVREWKLFLIQEFCEGGPLRELIDRGVFMWHTDTPLLPKVLHTALEVAAGMAHIHSRNVVHGDLKPDNVLMALNAAPPPAAPGPASMGRAPPPPLVAKVADFGLATKMEAGQTHVSNMCCGTFPYVSPEVLLHGNMTKAADVWSMGLLLWELAHGRPPWRAGRRRGAQVVPATPPFSPGRPPLGSQQGPSTSPPAGPGRQVATLLAGSRLPHVPTPADASRVDKGAAAAAGGARVAREQLPSGAAMAGAQLASRQASAAIAVGWSAAASAAHVSDPPHAPFRGVVVAAPAISSLELSSSEHSSGGYGNVNSNGSGEGSRPRDGSRVAALAHPSTHSPFATSAAAQLPSPSAARQQPAAEPGPALGWQAPPLQPHDGQPVLVGTSSPGRRALQMAASAGGAVAPGPGAVRGAEGAGAAAAAMALTSPPGLPPGATVDPSRLVWSPQLPPAYMALGRACLDSDPTRRPGFHHIVRQLLALQKEVNEAEAKAAAAAMTPSRGPSSGGHSS